jgi:hypothetical protein
MTSESQQLGQKFALPRIFKAERAEDGSGIVFRLLELTEAEAVLERQSERDIVVCGDDLMANQKLAQKIEAAIGRCVRSAPHASAGLDALPHFQPENRPPKGHSFYETPRRKARRKR